MENKPIFSLAGIGLIVIFGGALVRVLLQKMNATGILIDIARTTFFLGLILVILGLIKKKLKDKK